MTLWDDYEAAEEQRNRDLVAAVIKANQEWQREVLAWKPGDPPPILTGRIAKAIVESEMERQGNARALELGLEIRGQGAQ